MHEPTYDEARARRLIELLRGLATRIDELTEDQALLGAGPELMKIMGDVRSELFHYEVRLTYDTPEVAESRRIVDQARKQAEAVDLGDLDRDYGPEEGT